jgi:hypothetical protein
MLFTVLSRIEKRITALSLEQVQYDVDYFS